MFEKKIALFHEEASTRDEALKKLADEFVKAGVVRDDFYEGILKREANFPTGLITDTIGVAIPHTDSEYIIENQLGFMSLKEPVEFRFMADPDQTVQVKLMIMMALQSHDQVDMLCKLMDIFSDPELLNKLSEVNDFESFKEAMKDTGLV